jgi:hypothetical protein
MDELFNIINIDDILCGAYLTPAFIISYRYKATFPIVAGLFLIFHAERSRRAPLEGKTGKHSPNGHFGPGPYQLSVFFFSSAKIDVLCGSCQSKERSQRLLDTSDGPEAILGMFEWKKSNGHPEFDEFSLPINAQRSRECSDG